MTKVLKCDCNGADAYVDKTVTYPGSPGNIYFTFDLYVPANTLTNLRGAGKAATATFIDYQPLDGVFLGDNSSVPTLVSPAMFSTNYAAVGTASAFTEDTWHTISCHIGATDGDWAWSLDGTLMMTNHLGAGGTPTGSFTFHFGGWGAWDILGEVYYLDNIKVGSTLGGSEYFSDDFESGNLSAWTSTSGAVSVVDDPAPPPTGGRVLIAWDDGPLVANPTWTIIDQGGDFPENFVSGYDTHSGRQTLISQTETGTATVYVYDRNGLFDDRNGSSPYQGKLSGRQIMLQLYNPVTATWYSQFRGLIDDYRYTMDGSAVGADGNPVVADIEIDCVDMFDYLNGYGLTPGIDGTTPPAGAEDSVYFAASGISDTVEDRILEILGNANIDPAMSITASGNVQVIATQYNADESALTALRDAADAELPFIANIYVNRSGQFCFRGRYSSFAPDQVAAEAGSTWDFHRWRVGDGKAIQADPTRAQIRLLSYSRDRNEIINAAMCYPQGTPATAIPDQVYGNTVSIAAYGKHQANPMTDLITGKYVGFGTITPDDGQTQCYMYAELLVKNKKDPRLCPTAVQLKSIQPTDSRSSATWDILTRSDISDIVNIAVGYAGGTGLMGAATVDDYYIQGRALTVRPANTGYDEVELDLEVTPFVWSADTNDVFPAFGT